jgi:hypothetical protein
VWSGLMGRMPKRGLLASMPPAPHLTGNLFVLDLAAVDHGWAMLPPSSIHSGDGLTERVPPRKWASMASIGPGAVFPCTQNYCTNPVFIFICFHSHILLYLLNIYGSCYPLSIDYFMGLARSPIPCAQFPALHTTLCDAYSAQNSSNLYQILMDLWKFRSPLSAWRVWRENGKQRRTRA